MDAETYITTHWIPNKTWTHLYWLKHQKRLKRCTTALIGKTFADIGCACGHSTNIMAGFKNGIWTGIDFSNTAIKQARINFPKHNFIYISDSDNIQNGIMFDSIVCSEVIEHVENDELFVAMLNSLTKNVMVITTPSVFVDDPGHQRQYSSEQLLALGNKYGDVKLSNENGYFYLEVTK